MRNPVLYTPAHPILARPIARWMLIGALASITAAWIVVVGIPQPPDGEVVTHFTTTFGIDALGSWTSLLRLPMTGTVFVVMNTAIAFLLSPRMSTAAPAEVPATPWTAAMILLATSLLLGVGVLFGCVMLWRVNVVGM